VIVQAATQAVTWVKVEKPVFDLVGVVLGSLGLTGVIAAVALVLGISLGVALIVRARRRPASASARITLHLEAEAPRSNAA
jgi:FAD/FMN-containing dehydrogenase